MKINKLSKCALCKRGELDELNYGQLKCTKGVRAHYYCLLFSETITQSGTDSQGILGFLDSDILAELRRAKKKTCTYCSKLGATAGCANKFCQAKFHLPCGVENNTQHDFESFTSYCCKHGKQPNIPPRIKRSLINYKCVICLESLEPKDKKDAIWADCCKADIVLHLQCIKKLALSAGYFTKCPGCNNRSEFIKTIKLYGVFVPERDASWERASNAFAELYYVHDGCDAKQCHCPQGRRHRTERGKWKYFLCNLCGSSGTHQYCSQVKREFVCDICSLTECSEGDDGPVAVSRNKSCDVSLSRSDSDDKEEPVVNRFVNVEPRFDVDPDDDEIIIVDSDDEECGSDDTPKSFDILKRLSKEIKINSVTPSTSTSCREVAVKSKEIKINSVTPSTSTSGRQVAVKSTTRLPAPVIQEEEFVPCNLENEFQNNIPRQIENNKLDRIESHEVSVKVENDTPERIGNDLPKIVTSESDSQEIIVIDSDDEICTALVDNFSCELFEPVAKLVKYDDDDVIPPRSFISNKPAREKNIALKSTTGLPSLKRKRWPSESKSCQKENLYNETSKSNSNFRQRQEANIRSEDYDKTKQCSNQKDYIIGELNEIPINNLEYGSDEHQGSFIQYNVPLDVDGEIEFVNSPTMSVIAQVHNREKQNPCRIM